MEQTCLAIVVSFLITVIAASRPGFHECGRILSEKPTNAEMCEDVEYCLQMRSVNSVINGIYFKRGTSGEDSLDQYCISLIDFDFELQNSQNHLQKVGCSERNNDMGSTTSEGQFLVTDGFWNDSRDFLSDMNDIVCYQLLHQPSCTQRDYIYDFITCFRDVYLNMRPGLVRMLVAGPGKYTDKDTFCRAVTTLAECVNETVTNACDASMSEVREIIEELREHASYIQDMADCNTRP